MKFEVLVEKDVLYYFHMLTVSGVLSNNDYKKTYQKYHSKADLEVLKKAGKDVLKTLVVEMFNKAYEEVFEYQEITSIFERNYQIFLLNVYPLILQDLTNYQEKLTKVLNNYVSFQNSINAFTKINYKPGVFKVYLVNSLEGFNQGLDISLDGAVFDINKDLDFEAYFIMYTFTMYLFKNDFLKKYQNKACNLSLYIQALAEFYLSFYTLPLSLNEGTEVIRSFYIEENEKDNYLSAETLFLNALAAFEDL